MKNTSNGFAPIPIESMKWKKIEDFELNTPLGVDICTVEIADILNYIVLKPGEDERIRKAQVVLFCKWIVENREKANSEQLKYLLNLFEIKQTTLANSLAITGGAISHFIKGTSSISPSISRQIGLLFLKEVDSHGYIEELSHDKIPESYGIHSHIF